jgi:hypothetical protein
MVRELRNKCDILSFLRTLWRLNGLITAYRSRRRTFVQTRAFIHALFGAAALNHPAAHKQSDIIYGVQPTLGLRAG